jgi:hypothetical protein
MIVRGCRSRKSAPVSLSRPVFTVAAVLAVLLAATESPAAADPPSSPIAPAGAGAAPLPQVTISARRALQRKLSSFVYGITDLHNAEGVPRWNEPVCPLVAGLPREEGEFILGRVSEIARAAQVPLAGEHCLPNLHVLVSPDPEHDLKELHGRGRLVLFGYAPLSVVDEFISTSRAVKVWYKIGGSVDGIPVGGSSLSDRTPAMQEPGVSGPPAPPGGSRLLSSVVYGLGQVFVIVDQRRLHEVSRGQFADYVAMVGLAQIKPQAHLGDADTILRLFDSAPEAAPAGMSGWDQAFLKALYATDQRHKMQRDDMARVMLGELAPAPRPPQAVEK